MSFERNIWSVESYFTIRYWCTLNLKCENIKQWLRSIKIYEMENAFKSPNGFQPHVTIFPTTRQIPWLMKWRREIAAHVGSFASFEWQVKITSANNHKINNYNYHQKPLHMLCTDSGFLQRIKLIMMESTK